MTTLHLPDIALIGKAGAGKTTLADILQSRFGYQRMSFAAPLKVGCGTATDREVLQRVGVGVRELHPDFWVNLFMASYGAGEPGVPVVVDDCRFPNELERLRGEGFVVVEVGAPTPLRVTRLRANGKLQDEAQLEHASETALDGVVGDYEVWNVGKTHTELAYMLGQIVNRCKR